MAFRKKKEEEKRNKNERSENLGIRSCHFNHIYKIFEMISTTIKALFAASLAISARAAYINEEFLQASVYDDSGLWDSYVEGKCFMFVWLLFCIFVIKF